MNKYTRASTINRMIVERLAIRNRVGPRLPESRSRTCELCDCWANVLTLPFEVRAMDSKRDKHRGHATRRRPGHTYDAGLSLRFLSVIFRSASCRRRHQEEEQA